MGRAIGIDLGTTASVVAVPTGGSSVVVATRDGSRSTPSVVGFARSGEVLVGQAALNQEITNGERTVRSVIRRLGTPWSTHVDGSYHTAPEVTAHLLRKLKRDAEVHLGEEVTFAVIAIPARFTDAQRRDTREAARLADLNVLRFVSESSAAALAYGVGRADAEQTILVFDLGGGKLELAVLEIGGGVVEVRAVAGDDDLGGDLWHQRIVTWLLKRWFASGHRVFLNRDPVAMRRLSAAAEKAKIDLSGAQTVGISVPYIALDASRNPLSLEESLTRGEFQSMTRDLLDRTQAAIHSVLTDCGVAVSDLDHVLLVGGCSRMPAMTELITELTGKVPSRRINPEEAVAAGAAVFAGVITGVITDLLLLDVLGWSLGVEVSGGLVTRLVERNTTIPTKRTQMFTTLEDNQTSAVIRVHRGEHERADRNELLGCVALTGIAPAARGVPRIAVTADIDANGVTTVTAEIVGTGSSHTIRMPDGVGRVGATGARSNVVAVDN
jgi:molecular chaperone DnaK